jgi:hypothetical protein
MKATLDIIAHLPMHRDCGIIAQLFVSAAASVS